VRKGESSRPDEGAYDSMALDDDDRPYDPERREREQAWHHEEPAPDDDEQVEDDARADQAPVGQIP
jgi:hypothetical protein